MTRDLWRISHFATLNGEGGLRYSARWHTAGRPIVYLAESPAGALLEVLIHLELDPSELPPSSTLLRVRLSGEPSMQLLNFPGEAIRKVSPQTTRRIGDEWLAATISAFARVPSAILPHTFNVLYNPLHPDALKATIAEVIPFSLDERFFRENHL